MDGVSIFFPTEKLRNDYMKRIFKVEEKIYHKNMQDASIFGVKDISFHNKYKKIPGYWIRIELKDSQESDTIKRRIDKEIPLFWREEHLFFPQKLMSQRAMEKMWIQKYNLLKEGYSSDAWKIFLKEGKSHLEDGRVDIARAAFMCIYRNNPFFLKKYKRYYVFEDIAYYYETKGELHKSIKCLKVQASLQPRSSEAYLNMSNFLLLNGLEEEAIEVCKRGLMIEPDDEYLINNLLIAYVNCEYFDRALSFLEDRIKKYPDVSRYWKFMGDIFCQIGKDTAAIICYQKTLDMNDEDVLEAKQDIYYSLGICYHQICEYEKAIYYYERFLRYNKEDSIVLLNLSKIYGEDLKQYDQAKYYAKKVVALYPQNGYGHHNLGLIYLYTGNLEKARWHLYRARKLLPNYQPIWDAIVELKKKYSAL
ncbi:tetratricopeptide repeat protein [Crassaminicella indica]|uniref:Tetratricopeptide repeat protein n=1 Tax=Crassaminicella indica TaxID=2855394 RepID=A0ABX8RD51_9CLOT|nr:tetratricopeptide repeat protein [Crassaminicella indica]QXM06217.1 tetratricopeptide repeat protein [Crassaminicella indica]